MVEIHKKFGKKNKVLDAGNYIIKYGKMGENESLTKWQGRLEQVIPWTTWNDPALLSHLLYHVNP